MNAFDQGYEDGLIMKPNNPYPEGSKDSQQYEVKHMT